MTIWDALQALVRRWYVLLGAVLIGLLASYVAVTAEGAYWSARRGHVPGTHERDQPERPADHLQRPRSSPPAPWRSA